MEFKKGGVIYFLDRNTYNVNNPEELAVKMDIIELDGMLRAHAKQGYSTLSFELNEETTANFARSKRLYLFETREAALEQYNKEQNKVVNNVMNMTKETMLKEFFQAWSNQGTAVPDMKEYDAMKEKIKLEFGVEV